MLYDTCNYHFEGLELKRTISTFSKKCKKTLYSNSMQHKHAMPQSLLVFPVSFTPETPSFRTFGRVAHPPPENVF